MTRSLIAVATTLVLATSAGAQNITFSLPNLTFPTASDVTVSKQCLEIDATTQACLTQE